MALIRGNGGLDVRFYVRNPKKASALSSMRAVKLKVWTLAIAPLGRNGVFWRILHQNPSRALGCSELQEPKKTKKLTRFWCANSRMRGDEMPGRIVTNFCTCVGVHDVITCADLYCITIAYGVWAWRGVKFWFSPLTCVVALTTLSHYRASV